MLRYYRMREKEIYDYNNGILTAEQEGRQEEKALIAINLKQLGFSLEDIAKVTMLTTREIAQIINEQQSSI
jgi:predicted transposase YdaD